MLKYSLQWKLPEEVVLMGRPLVLDAAPGSNEGVFRRRLEESRSATVRPMS